jgi:hypothetical protein
LELANHLSISLNAGGKQRNRRPLDQEKKEISENTVLRRIVELRWKELKEEAGKNA